MDKILYILYTYNRPKVLQLSLKTLFNPKNTMGPSEMLVIDDGSNSELKDDLYNFSKFTSVIPIHFISFSTNQGLGWNWQLAWEWAKDRDFDYIVQLEQDYIYRQNAVEEGIEVLKIKPSTCAISMYSNPDYWNDKKDWLFKKVMIEEFGSDPAQREFLHKPFKINTNKFGCIEIQLSTNSCGSFICNWKRIKDLLNKYPAMWGNTFERSFHKNKNRKIASDGILTSGLSYYWYLDALTKEIDYGKEAPWIDICDFSLADHKNGGPSINGNILPELETFVGSPKWKNEYLDKDPRETI